MNKPTIPDKLMRQLNELVANQLVTVYEEVSNVSYGMTYPYSYHDHTAITVRKTSRPMQILDLFSNVDDKQSNLERRFNNEIELLELRKLKQSVANIKTVIGGI